MKTKHGRRWFSPCLACALATMGIGRTQTATEHVIHTFGDFTKGASPYGALIRDSSGDLYGTTYQGGTANLGTVFKLGASGYQVLYSFRGGTDAANPLSGVTLDSAGNLYGTTYNGGAAGAGAVYKLEPTGQEMVLYSFTGGADGDKPYAGVIVDSAGNLYGTTYYGGVSGKGNVYKVSASGQETVLHSFTGGADGGYPYAGVIADAAGNLYGTTYAGGITTGPCYYIPGCGVVYKLDMAGHETVLHAFAGKSSTLFGWPYAGVISDAAGNLYGTTSAGAGGVYKVGATGNYTVLHEFFTGHGLSQPKGGLAVDAQGNLYGTTQYGGAANAGGVFALDKAGKLQTLHTFPGGGFVPPAPDAPNPGVVLDSAGNVYGVTPYAGVAGMVYKLSSAGQEMTLYSFGGAAGGTDPGTVSAGQVGELYGATYVGGTANAGVLYKLDTAGHETLLYSFKGGADGAGPKGGVAFDSAGNLYGSTVHGGAASGDAGFGVVFKVDASGRETVLYAFTGGEDGGMPSGIIRDPAGNLYGTTFLGGEAGVGVVFELDPAGHESVLHSFAGGADGASPDAGVVRDSAGNLYGTTFYGGTANAGVVYKLDTAGQETVIYTFAGFGASGGNPYAGVTLDSVGDLYGTTVNYGTTASGGPGGGVVFELDAAGNYAVLYTFTGGEDGGAPFVGVVRDASGNLYGANSGGGTPSCNSGAGCGVTYELSASGRLAVLHSFTGGDDGTGSGAVMLDAAGNLYGPAEGGASGGGLLYKLVVQGQ
jgi:uncharacterized repeat protein (TIGR03803 family)